MAFGWCGWNNDMESLLTVPQTSLVVSSRHEKNENEANSQEKELRTTTEHWQALFEPAIQDRD